MIISHKYRFIFVQTRRCATSSIQAYLSQFLGKEDVITEVENITDAKNCKGSFNPIPDILWCVRNRALRKYLLVLGVVVHTFISKEKYYNHIPAEAIRARVGKKIWNNYFKFTVERNPFDKEISLYHHHKALYHKNDDYSFRDFMKENDHCYNYPLYTDRNGKIIVDYVVRYENLNEELKIVFNKIGIPFKELPFHIKQHNFDDVSKTKFYKDYPQYAEMIKRIFKKEFETFGYSGEVV